MRARPLPARAVVLLLLLLLVSACRGAPEPTPTTPPPPDPTNPDPLTLELSDVQLAPMGNGEILAGTAAEGDTETAEQAVEATRAALERFLNAQFVDRATRFSQSPARELLQPGVFDTLPPPQRAAMGVQYQPVSGVLPRSATGTAMVLFDRGRAYAVSIDYRVEVDLFYGPDPGASEDQDADEGQPGSEDGIGGPRRLSHRGTVLFTAPLWSVESFEFHIASPDVPVPPPSTATADPEPDAT